MMERRRCPMGRHPESGATLVEFALVAPIVFLMIFGLIAGCFLVYQNSALHDGATAGARMASIDLSPTTVTPDGSGDYCVSGTTTSIQTAIAQAAPLLTVNPAPLCGPGSGAPPTVLASTPTVPGDVNITVTCGGGGTSAAPSAMTGTVEVMLQLTTKGLVAPIGLTYHMTASSQVPLLIP